MQPQPKNDLVYILTILEAAGKIAIYSKDFPDANAFFQSNDQLNFNASLLLIATIGDQIAKISEPTKSKYHHIQWKKIKDTRNRIVHDYAGVDFEITFEIVRKETPLLIADMEKIVQEEIEEGTFSLEELNIAHNSEWYLHVNFAALK